MTKKEKLMMIKQLGMTHLLYYIRRKAVEVFSTSADQQMLKQVYGSISMEDIILHWMYDEDKIIDYLDSAEKDYNEKLKNKRQCTGQVNTSQIDQYHIRRQSS